MSFKITVRHVSAWLLIPKNRLLNHIALFSWSVTIPSPCFIYHVLYYHARLKLTRKGNTRPPKALFCEVKLVEWSSASDTVQAIRCHDISVAWVEFRRNLREKVYSSLYQKDPSFYLVVRIQLLWICFKITWLYFIF